MRKLSGDSCSHQLQAWLLQFDGLRSWYSTETAICLGEQPRGLIGTNFFQHISLILLITSKFNFTSHWRSHSLLFWQENNSEADFVTSATALDSSMKQTCFYQYLRTVFPGISFSSPSNLKPHYSWLVTILLGVLCWMRMVEELVHISFKQLNSKCLLTRAHSLTITSDIWFTKANCKENFLQALLQTGAVILVWETGATSGNRSKRFGLYMPERAGHLKWSIEYSSFALFRCYIITESC